ncbi:hypothetical protein ONE63_007001 [Megalurothrips usitatus]|uniref:Uncharacterized protein n=1 Tax=Megalurothrips usitatus TaxID=439358 RepID=A0AAV7XUQ6_9NEOP|nr:hypothetical protein ONE63_007001 [Megalurothrips usitatus]
MAPPRLGAGALLVLAALVRAAPTTTTASVSSTTATPPTAPAGRQQPADEDAEPHLILSVRDHALCNGLRCKEGNGGPKPACGIWDTNKYFLFDSLCDMLYFSCMTERSTYPA